MLSFLFDFLSHRPYYLDKDGHLFEVSIDHSSIHTQLSSPPISLPRIAHPRSRLTTDKVLVIPDIFSPRLKAGKMTEFHAGTNRLSSIIKKPEWKLDGSGPDAARLLESQCEGSLALESAATLG